MDTKNRFAGAAIDDSDDEVIDQKTTKTQKKKEERKITEKVAPVMKVNASKMAEGGFEVISKVGDAPRPSTANRGGDRGGRGRGGENRPRGAARPAREGKVTRLDSDGNPIREEGQRERRPFTGKPREEAHPMDRQSGTGRGRRPENKRDGHGKGNWGDSEDKLYKKKGEEVEGAVLAEVPEVAEVKEEKKVPEEPKVIIKEEIIGVSLADYMQNKTT